MAIPLTGLGGLWQRTGRLIAGLNELNADRGATLNAREGLVRAQFAGSDQFVLDGLTAAKASWQTTDTWANQLKTYAKAVLTQMATDDGWPGGTFLSALTYLQTQMVGTGTFLAPQFSILKPAVGLTVSSVAGMVGNGVCRGSVVNPIDALAMDYTLAESSPIVCTAHAYPGGTATFGQEPFSWAGAASAPSVLGWNWPAGSGQAASMNALNESSGVLLNGAFETWTTPNIPDSWTIVVGNAGTTVLKGVSPYVGTANLDFRGDAATLHSIRQPVTLSPQTAYAVNWWNKVTAAPGAGSVRVRLEDVNGNPVLDPTGQAGTNSLSTTLVSLGVGYTSNGGWFYTPRLLPSAVYLSVTITGTALANLGDFQLDRLVCSPGVQLYNGGPLLAVFAGSVGFAVGDQFLIVPTNSFGTATLARGLDRMWDLRDNGVRVPSRTTGDAGTQDNTAIA